MTEAVFWSGFHLPDTYQQPYAETRPSVIWTGKTYFGWVEIWVDGWWMGKKLKTKGLQKS